MATVGTLRTSLGGNIARVRPSLPATLRAGATEAVQREIAYDPFPPEELGCPAINATQCRVSYHCHFALPSGWRGWLLRMVLWRELRVGPEDSLRRLKRAAEQRSAVTVSSVG